MENLVFRKAKFGQIDLAARSVPVVLTTTAPVKRQGYIEILDLGKVDLSRGDLPLLESHNADQLNIGRIVSIHVDGDKLRGVAVFGTSTRANEVLADVEAGIVTGVSIGYELTDEGASVRGEPLARSFGFRPYECSVVAVPADTNAGFFRTGKTLTLKHSERFTMNTSTQTPALETRNHAAEISAIARTLPNGAELAMRAIEAGQTVEEFQQVAIKALSTKPLPTSDVRGHYEDAAVHMVQPRMLRNASDIRRHYAARQDFAAASGVTLVDFLRGAARMKTTAEATRSLAIAVDSSGGFAVPTAVMPGILEALIPASSLLTAGAGILPLSDGAKSYNFAAVDTLPTAAWRVEGGAIAVSAPTFKNTSITPRSLSFVVKISRELLADAPNVDAALQTAIAQAFAVEIDRVGLLGSGTAPEPRGLKNISGVLATIPSTNGITIENFSAILDGVERILEVNGPMPSAAIMSPRSLVEFGGLRDNNFQPLQRPDLLAGVRFIQTSQLPNNLTQGTANTASDIFLGDFSQLVIALREQINVQVLTEAYADFGEIGFLCHARLDIATQRPQAFCLIPGNL